MVVSIFCEVFHIFCNKLGIFGLRGSINIVEYCLFLFFRNKLRAYDICLSLRGNIAIFKFLCNYFVFCTT